MTLIPVEKPEDFSLAQQFVIPHEETCVSLASLVRRKSDRLFFISSDDNEVLSTRSFTSSNGNSILGIINLDSTLYHCIPNPALIDADFLRTNLPYYIKKPVHCLSGEKTSNDFLVEIISKINMSSVDKKLTTDSYLIPKMTKYYKMMRMKSKIISPVSSTGNGTNTLGHSNSESDSLQINLSGGEEIIRCTEHDIESLTPLQKDYMKEEVTLPGKNPTDAEAAIMLRQILKNQLCFALTFDGDFVAKANTNAIGINCVQIGGVYTSPLYRRNGYAGALVTALCNRARRAGKKPVLFVKEKNIPAFNLYQKLGFEECGHYAIAYF